MKNVIYGRNPVKEALKSQRAVREILISKTAGGLTEILSLAKANNVVVKFVSAEKIKNFSTKTQGVVAFCEIIKTVTVCEILNFAKKNKKPPFILICAKITDPHNLGALCRTAYAVGVSGVIIAKRRSAPINETVEKASAGAINFLNIAVVANLTETIKNLQKQGIFVYCADGAGKNMYDFNFKGAVALVVGSEEKGVGDLIKKTCDDICCVPMMNSINSLNVSVAAAVVLYAIAKQNNFYT